jgi:hypothetical protein
VMSIISQSPLVSNAMVSLYVVNVAHQHLHGRPEAHFCLPSDAKITLFF